MIANDSVDATQRQSQGFSNFYIITPHTIPMTVFEGKQIVLDWEINICLKSTYQIQILFMRISSVMNGWKLLICSYELMMVSKGFDIMIDKTFFLLYAAGIMDLSDHDRDHSCHPFLTCDWSVQTNTGFWLVNEENVWYTSDHRLQLFQTAYLGLGALLYVLNISFTLHHVTWCVDIQCV